MGETLTNDDVDDMLRAADTDDDGVINYNGWYTRCTIYRGSGSSAG